MSEGIAISRLSVDFTTDAGITHAVRDISLEVGAGRIVGLVGESGSGKSTVGLALMGLLANNARVTSGELALGKDSYDLGLPNITAPLRGRRIAMIFQDPLSSLNPVFTIKAHVFEVLKRRSPELDAAGRWRAGEAALAAVGIDRPAIRLRQYPHELSGGMRQRVAIAMALIARPALLIADEPTTALDVTVEAQVLAEIKKLRDAIGCSILFITHSLGLVAQHCDDIAVMYSGEIVEQGPVASVAAKPGHPYAAALLACEVTIDHPREVNPRDARFRVIRGGLPDPYALPSGCIYRTRCEYAFDDCAKIVPPSFAVDGDPGHRARCLLLESA